MMTRSAFVLALSLAACGEGALASGARLFLASDGNRLVRANSTGVVLSEAVLSAEIVGMTVVPEGVTIAGAPAGSVIALDADLGGAGERQVLYRIEDPFGAAALVEIGSLEGGVADLTFWSGRLFGVRSPGGVMYVDEFDPATLDRITAQDAGLRESSAGGLAWHVGMGMFMLTNESRNALLRWEPGTRAKLIGGPGLDFADNDLEYFGGELYAALVTDGGAALRIGVFNTDSGAFAASVTTSHGVGVVGLAVVTCGPDCNDDGKLNINDFICFQSEWRRRTAYGDHDGSGTYTVNDFLRFQAAFVEGCGY